MEKIKAVFNKALAALKRWWNEPVSSSAGTSAETFSAAVVPSKRVGRRGSRRNKNR